MHEKQLNIIKKSVAVSGVALASAAALSLGCGALLFNFALNKNSKIHMTKLAQSSKKNIAANDDTSKFSGIAGTPQQQQWYKDLRKDVYITSSDGLKLHGFFVQNNNGENKYVITCHGYTSHADHMASFVKHFYDLGFSVIAPDARAHGSSEGSIIGMGWLERKDILSWVDFILEQNSSAKIFLHGVSMGAATVMMAAGENLPSNVKAVVEDCGYTSVFDECAWQAKSMFKLPAFPFIYAASLFSEIKGGYSLREASAVEQLKKSKLPILCIHGDKDSFVPYAMLDKVYAAASGEREKLLVKGADHALSQATDSEAYWETIKTFTDKYLN